MQKCEAFLLMFFNYLVLPELAQHLALSKLQTQINLADPAPLHNLVMGWFLSLIDSHFNWYVVINNWQQSADRNIPDGQYLLM